MGTIQNQTENKEGVRGIFTGMGGFTGWIRSLMGKSPVSKETSQPNTSSQQVPPEEDSVREDVQKFKTFVRKSITKVSTSSKPFTSKGLATGSVLTSSLKGAFENKFIKRLVRTFLILVFLMILIFIGIKLFRLLQEDGEVKEPRREVTPTPASYQPYKPSVYANDPEVLQLEEDINVLEREISGSNLREDKLIPPNLDYNVSFK